ncbi:unnamed protein product, partial [Mesorhabditis spiculigera]
MSKQPPVRPAKLPEPKGGPQGILDAIAEKDELLLYFTAFLGVVLPGVVYLIYRRVHVVYERYAAKKEAERIADIKARCQISIFYCGKKKAEQKAQDMMENYNDGVSNIYDLTSIDASIFYTYKGFALFVIDKFEEKAEWFLEWLEDVAADKRLKKKTSIEEVRYAIFAMNGGKAVTTLGKRMTIVGAKEIWPAVDIDKELTEEQENALFEEWRSEVLEEVDNFFIDQAYDDGIPDELSSEDEDGSEGKKDR